MIHVQNNVPRPDAALGIIRAEGIRTDRYPSGFDARLAALIQTRRADLAPQEEAVRQATRDLLRNGRYKPTGRGKPASEYLVRVAQRPDAFPRINAPVDVCNYVSLRHLLPVSLWNLDRAAAERFTFRLGQAGEAYVFNSAGQEIELEDLLVGCRVQDGAEEPLVNPVKDSLLTKTTDATTRVAACIYTPLGVVTADQLRAICAAFAEELAGCGEAVETAFAVLLPGEAALV